MKIVYRANDIIEAHIVAGMLRANAIDAYVGGHYLQGGIGDLARAGFANVFVNDEDVVNAAVMVREYESSPGDRCDDIPSTIEPKLI